MRKNPAANPVAGAVNGEWLEPLITIRNSPPTHEFLKTPTMNIRKASPLHREAIITLLQSQGLPSGDLPQPLQDFYVALEEEKVIGLIGMERYGSFGLLRSMVVHPDYRNRHIAERLVQLLEEKAKASGTHHMYLLTETAEAYFGRKGYSTISREDVPAEVQASSEFSHVCPASATVMKKNLITHH